MVSCNCYFVYDLELPIDLSGTVTELCESQTVVFCHYMNKFGNS